MVSFFNRFSAIFSIVMFSVYVSSVCCHAFPCALLTAEIEEALSKKDALSKLPSKLKRTDIGDTFLSPFKRGNLELYSDNLNDSKLELFGFKDLENAQGKIEGTFFITNFCATDIQIHLRRYSWGWMTHEKKAQTVTTQNTHIIPLKELEGDDLFTHIEISLNLKNGRTRHLFSYPLRTFLGSLIPRHLAFVDGHDEPLIGKIENDDSLITFLWS